MIAELAANGLVQGERGLAIYVMCEILVTQGIDSLSLNPDSQLKMMLAIVNLEKTLGPPAQAGRAS